MSIFRMTLLILSGLFAAWSSLIALGSALYARRLGDPVELIVFRHLVYLSLPWIGLWLAVARQRFEFLAVALVTTGLVAFWIDPIAKRDLIVAVILAIAALVYATRLPAGRADGNRKSDLAER